MSTGGGETTARFVAHHTLHISGLVGTAENSESIEQQRLEFAAEAIRLLSFSFGVVVLCGMSPQAAQHMRDTSQCMSEKYEPPSKASEDTSDAATGCGVLRMLRQSVENAVPLASQIDYSVTEVSPVACFSEMDEPDAESGPVENTGIESRDVGWGQNSAKVAPQPAPEDRRYRKSPLSGRNGAKRSFYLYALPFTMW